MKLFYCFRKKKRENQIKTIENTENYINDQFNILYHNLNETKFIEIDERRFPAIRLGKEVMKMGGLVEKSLFDAAAALVKSDIELAKKVKEHDQVIDSLEEEVNIQTVRLIALRSPAATDLRYALSFIKKRTYLLRN